MAQNATARIVTARIVTARIVMARIVTARIVMVQISAPPNVVIQNGSAQNAVIPTAMDVPVVRSYLGATASTVPHFAATQISMVPNAVALSELVQIAAPRNVGIRTGLVQIAVTPFSPEPHFVVAALRCAVEPPLVRVAHFFAFVVQRLVPVIRSAAQVAPARFAHGHA